MKTQNEVRREFLGYYEDLCEAQRLDGAPIPRKSEEWDYFLETNILNGDLPSTAAQWACPRK